MTTSPMTIRMLLRRGAAVLVATAVATPLPAAAQFMPNLPGVGQGRTVGSQIVRPDRKVLTPRAGQGALIIAPRIVNPGSIAGGGGRGTRPPTEGSNTGSRPPSRDPKLPRVVVPAPPKAIDPPRVAILCTGGKVRDRRCICPANLIPRDGVCTRIVEPRPPHVPPGVIIPPLIALPPVIGTPPPPGARPPLPPSQLPASGPLPVQQALDLYVPDEVLISLPVGSPTTLEEALAQTYNLVILERASLPLLAARVVRLRIPDQRRVVPVVTALQADPRVAEAQENFYYRHQQGVGPATPGGLQYSLTKVNLVDAHRLASGKGATVAMIDSGVDARHPDLAAAVVEEFDAVTDAAPADLSQLDTHGTSIAGIIAAEGTVRGVAPKARLLSARAFSGNRGAATATTYAVIRCIDWALGKGARVLNLSFAGPRDPMLERGVKAATAQRAIIIAAAGNGGPDAIPVYPAAYAEVIAVTATDERDRIYEKANRGRYIAIAAPGVDILALMAGSGHGFQSGTSFAAAHVSGIVALALELDPGLGADALRRALVAGAIDLGAPGHDEEFGAGRTNAAATLDHVRAEVVRRVAP